MRKISWLLTCLMVLAASCGSADIQDETKSLIEKKIEIIREDNKNKEVAILADMIKLQEEHGDDMKPFIDDQVKKIVGNHKSFALDQFIESPNRNLKIPSNVSQVHLRNNYPSGNTVVVLKKDGKVLKAESFEFNSEFKHDLALGKYEFYMLIDRNFNDNIFLFKSQLNLRGGELYLGEFTIISQLNKSGSCESNEIADTDMCIRPFFKILDNCDPGFNLVEHLCCEDGFNFIMNGKCSRYSDTVESVVCPAGYHEAGKGRCCPKGTVFLDNRCQEPPKGEPTE
jgi:hypothetical protein